MTRLSQFLIPVGGFGLVWVLLVTGLSPVDLPSSWWQLIRPLPFYILIVFGCYALASVGFNVYKVKCDDGAAEQLLKDIENAKAGLQRKGFVFSKKTT